MLYASAIPTGKRAADRFVYQLNDRFNVRWMACRYTRRVG